MKAEIFPLKYKVLLGRSLYFKHIYLNELSIKTASKESARYLMAVFQLALSYTNPFQDFQSLCELIPLVRSAPSVRSLETQEWKAGKFKPRTVLSAATVCYHAKEIANKTYFQSANEVSTTKNCQLIVWYISSAWQIVSCRSYHTVNYSILMQQREFVQTLQEKSFLGFKFAFR